jgi:PIN domain nuclease of toxin-antitoxin system
VNVFDSSALIAYLRRESGSDVVREHLLAGGACSAANWSEVAQKVQASGADRSMSSCVESFEQNLGARFLGSVDADGVGRRGCGRLAAEPFGVRGVVGLLGGVALLPEGAPAPVVDLIR